jgi:hypothetical protein
MDLRVCAAALAALAVTSAADAARAAPVVDTFNRLCLSSAAPADAIARARADGYVRAPADMRARLKGFPDDGELLWRTGEGEVVLFIAATVKRDIANSATQAMSGDVCVVASMPAQLDMQTDIERLLDVGPAQSFGKATGYMFEETDGRRVRIDAADKALVGVKTLQGSARVVSLMQQSGMSGAMLILPRIAAK